jgi:hypothetical protein
MRRPKKISKPKRSAVPAWFKPYIAKMDAAHAEVAKLNKWNESLAQVIAQLDDALKHLNAALHQRGVWNHDYSAEKEEGMQ